MLPLPPPGAVIKCRGLAGMLPLSPGGPASQAQLWPGCHLPAPPSPAEGCSLFMEGQQVPWGRSCDLTEPSLSSGSFSDTWSLGSRCQLDEGTAPWCPWGSEEPWWGEGSGAARSCLQGALQPLPSLQRLPLAPCRKWLHWGLFRIILFHKQTNKQTK